MKLVATSLISGSHFFRLSSLAMRLLVTSGPRVMGLFGAGLALLVLGAPGCKCSEDDSAPAGASASASASATPKKPKPALSGPLTGPAWIELGQTKAAEEEGARTSAPGFAVWVPVGAEKPRPIVVLLDSASAADKSAVLPAQLFDRLKQDVVVMSFRGPPNDARTSLRAALTELKERYGAYVAPGSVLLVATARFSAEAANLLREEPTFFSRALLFELDPDVWSSTLSYVFAQRGGERLVITTSDPKRRSGIEHTKTITERAGAATRALFVPLAAPLPPDAPLPPEVVEAGLAELGFLVSGDVRFPSPAGSGGEKTKPSAAPSGTPAPTPSAPTSNAAPQSASPKPPAPPAPL